MTCRGQTTYLGPIDKDYVFYRVWKINKEFAVNLLLPRLEMLLNLKLNRASEKVSQGKSISFGFFRFYTNVKYSQKLTE